MLARDRSSVPGSRLHLAGGPADQPRSRPDEGANGLGLLGVQLGLRAVRGARRMARATGIGPRRVLMRVVALVVVLHRGDRLGLERDVAHRHARAVRRRRGRLLSEPDAHLHDVAAGGGARARAGAAVVLGALERRVHAAAGRLHARVHVVAAHLRALRAAGRHLGDRVLPLVSRRSADASGRQRRRARAAAAAGATRRSARPSPGGRILRTARSGCCAFSTPSSPTAGIST